MKTHGFINLLLVFSFLTSNLVGITTKQITYTTPGISWNIAGRLQTAIGRIDSWLNGLSSNILEQTKTSLTSVLPSPTPTRGFGIAPSPQPTQSLIPTQTQTLLPTDIITPTLTPTPEGGFALTTFDVTLDPDPAAPGDVVTATWTINNYRGPFDGVEIWAYLPEAFVPLNLGNGSFDPVTNLLIIPINGPNGTISWFIEGNALPPYNIRVEVHRNGQVILSLSRLLGKRAPDSIPIGGGEAHGFNRHVKVDFPPGALTEDVNVTVSPPQNTDVSLGGQAVELTAIGRQSGREITQFTQPVTITVDYTDEKAAQVLANAGMTDESSLTLFYYDEVQRTWFPLDTSVDPVANQLTATTNHFTLFDYKAQNWEASRLPSLDGFQMSGFTGATTYSFPIQVPPGPGGLQPSLELSYNSQEVDSAASRTQASWVGMGWSLDTGYIQRNMNGTPNYFEDDTFTLVMNGVSGLLLPIADQDGDPNTIDYHFANERFWRVRQYLSTGTGGGYPEDTSGWVVFAPDGTQYYFGNYSDGSLAAHAWYPAYPNGCASIIMQTWDWGMATIRNIFGSEIHFGYSTENAPSQKYGYGCSGYPAAMAVAMYPASIVYPNFRYRVIFVREDDGSGVGYRQDYDPAWNAANSTMLYMRSKLLRIEIWQDPNGVWNSGDEVLIRKYVLNYGENSQQIYPGDTWPAGGTTPTLTSITEYGVNPTNSLPKTEFTYDNMHLATVKNGYGGTITLNYDTWHANDGFEDFAGSAPGYISGEYYPDSLSPYGDDLVWLKTYFSPGTYYKIVATVWTNAGNSWVKLGLDDGTAHVYSGQHNLTTGQWNTVTDYVQISRSASQARALLYCYTPDNSGCKLNDYKVYPVVSRYRTITKTITDEVTNINYLTQYAYDGAAVNDTTISTYVVGDPGGAHLLTKPNTEFRGHSHVTETDPDGKVLENWFHQDDIYKGQNYQTRVSDNSGHIYTQTGRNFTNIEQPTFNLPHPQGQPPDTDLKILWVYISSEDYRTYNGDSTYVTTLKEYQYDTSDQGGAQYGNLTRIIESYYNGSSWVAYRGTRTGYFPEVTNGTPVSSRYLTGLPGYTNTYQCPGGCDWSASDVASSKWYLYDANTLWSGTPTDGKLNGQRILIYYDAQGNPMYADTKYGYDTWGNRGAMTVYTDATGTYNFGLGSVAQTSHSCYGTGTAPTCNTDNYNTYLAWETNPLGQTTTYSYDKTKSVPLSFTDANQVTTSATYDDFGRILTILRPGDTGSTLALIYHQASAPFLNNPFYTQASQLITSGEFYVLRKYYNGIGQLIQTQVVGATIGTSTRDILADTFYDAGGRVSDQSMPYDVATGSNYHVRDSGQPNTHTNYDVLGRTVDVIASDNSTTHYTYSDGYTSNIPYQYTAVANPRNYTTTTQSDIWGRVVNVTPPTGPSVTYTYDVSDRLLTATRGGASTTLSYDFGGRKVTMSDADMGMVNWTYNYDALGNMTAQTDAHTNPTCTTTLSYDLLNRLTGKSYSGNCGVTTASVTYTYDSGTNGKGHRTGMSDGSGSTSWTYDARGRMMQESKVITGSGTFNTSWGYNSADLVTSMTYPGDASGNTGEQVTYAYLPQMLLDRVYKDANTVYVNNTDYDAAGRVTLRDLGLSSGNPVISMNYSYWLWTDANGQGRLKQIADNLQDLRYTYDANGNVLTIKDYKAGSPQTQTFTYDALDRLATAVTSGGTGGTYALQNYGYDATTGNLSSMGTLNYTYGDANHKHAVTAAGSNSFSYDANGNQTGRTVGGSSYTLSYDAENRLVSVSGAATATFVYDGDGNRVKGIIGTTTTTYIGNYFEWKTTTSDMVKYYYAGSIRVAMRTGSSTLNYLLGDHLGSQSITTNSSGSKTGEIRYFAWGTERYTYGTTPTNNHFTGQRLESSLGIYYYGARWYDPAAGRFIQPDTLIPQQQGVQAWDRYAYTNNNPVKYTDPSGNKEVCPEGDACNEKPPPIPSPDAPPDFENPPKGAPSKPPHVDGLPDDEWVYKKNWGKKRGEGWKNNEDPLETVYRPDKGMGTKDKNGNDRTWGEDPHWNGKRPNGQEANFPSNYQWGKPGQRPNPGTINQNTGLYEVNSTTLTYIGEGLGAGLLAYYAITSFAISGGGGMNGNLRPSVQ